MPVSAAAPSAQRLDAAIKLIVERLAPDQIILFGSGARNEMTPSSDLDLLVIQDEDGNRPSSPRHERWECPDNGDQIDVLVMNRTTAERHRLSASHVQGAALEEGRTVYLRDGVRPTATGPTYTWNGATMVRTTKYEPDHAAELLGKAERRWRTANREEHPADKCEYLQRSMEYAFKALITADGRRVKHRHDLNNLWQEAEATGESIGAIRDPNQLKTLSKYAGEWRCDTPDDDPEVTWKENRTTGEDILNHARRRVPQLIEQTRQALARPQQRRNHRRDHTARSGNATGSRPEDGHPIEARPTAAASANGSWASPDRTGAPDVAATAQPAPRQNVQDGSPNQKPGRPRSIAAPRRPRFDETILWWIARIDLARAGLT